MSVRETRNVSTFERMSSTSRSADDVPFPSRWNDLRSKFNLEVRRLEDEMARMKTNFSSLRTSTRTSTQSNTVSTGSSEAPRGSSTWLESLNSPLIQDTGDNKMLKLRFDVSQYAPEEIVVKTVDNKLLVHAKHEEKSESKSVYREYNREFLLPKGTNPESIKSSLSKDGVLTVEAPLPALGAPEKMIPIAQN